MTQNEYNALWIIVNKLTKVVHFLPIKDTTPEDQLEKLYVREIVKLHRVPKNNYIR